MNPPDEIPQLELDLSVEAQRLGRLQEASSLEFSEERLCLAWITESDGRAWLDWWAGISERERYTMLEDYRFERRQANVYFRGRMKPYSSVLALAEDRFQAERRAAEAWAAEIKAAAIARRPLPFHLHEDATGTERARFEQRLAMAFQIAGVVIIQAEDPAPKKSRRKKTEAAA